jgi:hypothetical protein
MNKDSIAEGIFPVLKMVEKGDISPENASKLLSMHILALFRIWKGDENG